MRRPYRSDQHNIYQVIAICIIVTTVWVTGPVISSLVFDIRLAILQKIAQSQQIYHRFFDHAQRQKELIQKNHELERQLASYQWLQKRQRVFEKENRQLRDILQVSAMHEPKITVNKPLHIHQSAHSHYLLLPPSKEGPIKENSLVTDSRSIVGITDHILHQGIKVNMLTNPNTSLPVVIKDKNISGIAKGNGSHLLDLCYISESAKIQIGDVVINKEMEKSMDSRYIVGTVEEIIDGKEKGFLQIKIQPAANIHYGTWLITH